MSEQVKAKTEPFGVYTNQSGKRFLRYTTGGVERFSRCLQVVPPSYLAYMVKWINELLAEKADDQELVV